MTARSTTLSHIAAQALPPWWEKIDGDSNWQRYSFLGLAVGYGLIALVAIIQLIRIQRRVPEYGWTTQKVFHLLNAFVCVLRCVVFALRSKVGPWCCDLKFVLMYGPVWRCLHCDLGSVLQLHVQPAVQLHRLLPAQNFGMRP